MTITGQVSDLAQISNCPKLPKYHKSKRFQLWGAACSKTTHAIVQCHYKSSCRSLQDQYIYICVYLVAHLAWLTINEKNTIKPHGRGKGMNNISAWNWSEQEIIGVKFKGTWGLIIVFRRVCGLEDTFWGQYFFCSRSQRVVALVSQSDTNPNNKSDHETSTVGWGLKAKSWWIDSAVAKFIAFGHTFAMKIIFSPQKRFSSP